MNILANTKQFVYEVRAELAKVIWPTKQEFIGSTIVVLFLVAVFSIYLGLVDAVLVQLMRSFFKLFI